jgi:hypothetical protein
MGFLFYAQMCWLYWGFGILIDLDQGDRVILNRSENERGPEIPARDRWGFEFISGFVGFYCDLQ